MLTIVYIFFIAIFFTSFIGLPKRSGGRQIPRPPEQLRPKETKKKKVK